MDSNSNSNGNFEFVTVRGKLHEGVKTWAASGHEIIVVVIPADRQDAANADIYAQQNIAIVPGLKIEHKKSGTLFEVLSPPTGFMKQISIKDVRRNLTPVRITESELRRNYRFVG